MKRASLGTFFDVVCVQLGWWSCVLGAANGLAPLGPVVVGVLFVVQTWGLPSSDRRRAWFGALALGVAGTIVDSILGGLGLLSFEGKHISGLSPLWMTVLWCHFVTVIPTFAVLRPRLPLAALVGAVGAPLSYAGGVRLGAASFCPEPWLSLMALALVWGVALPWMLVVFVEPTRNFTDPQTLVAGGPG